MKTQMLCIETTKVWDLIIIICKALCPQAGAVLNSCLHETKEKFKEVLTPNMKQFMTQKGLQGSNGEVNSPDDE